VSTVAQEQALIEGVRSEMPSVVAIYLFGSAAAGELRTDSDIDLAVLPAAPAPTAQLWSLAQGLEVSAGRDVDLIDLLSASTVMCAQVISKGKRLYCANELLCSNFEDRVYADYARLNEERRHILDDIRERGRIYD
jgi:predicted nucleotidyltransferase